MELASLVAIFFPGPKKSQFPGPIPSNVPRNGSCPPQNHYVPRHINNRIVNTETAAESFVRELLRRKAYLDCILYDIFSMSWKVQPWCL
jgi:hypothetical protein